MIGSPTIAASVGDAFQRLRGGLVSWLTSMTRDRAQAEDVASEAFERLLMALHHGNAPDDTMAWLRRVSLTARPRARFGS